MNVLKKSNINKLFVLIIFILMLLLLTSIPMKVFSVPVEPQIAIYLFGSEACHYCAEEEDFLSKMKDKYSWIEVKKIESFENKNNYNYLKKFLKEHNEKYVGVPVTVIGDKIFAGYFKGGEDVQENAIKKLKGKNIDLIAKTRDQLVFENNLKDRENDKRSQDIQGSSNVVDSNDKENQVDSPKKITEYNNEVQSQEIFIPYLGMTKVKDVSIPLLTIIIALLDSLNPCSFFIMFSLMGLLTHARSRKRILFVGVVFSLTSGIIYFLFMAAWLDINIITINQKYITIFAGIISVIIGGINIKDFFAYKQGISLTMPDEAKPKLYRMMRRLTASDSLFYLFGGTLVLALAANTYEVICTAGLPMIYTRILTLSSIKSISYYAYLGLYNIIYIIPLLVITAIFAVFMVKRQLTIWQGRVLKLVSGVIMFELGACLALNPDVFSNILLSIIIFAIAIVLALVVAKILKDTDNENEK